MESTNAPRPGEIVLIEVSELLTAVYSLLEAGAQKARKFTEDECDGKYDPWLFPMIVRNVVCRGLDALTAGNVKFSRREIANDGIELTYGKYTIKVWKATPDGELPPTGDSDARRAFCNGNLFREDIIVYRSLVIMWEITSAGALRVQLVAPRSASSPREVGEQLWAEPVPHPATQIHIPPVKEIRPEDDLEHFQPKDLPSTQTGESEGEDE